MRCSLLVVLFLTVLLGDDKTKQQTTPTPSLALLLEWADLSSLSLSPKTSTLGYYDKKAAENWKQRDGRPHRGQGCGGTWASREDPLSLHWRGSRFSR